MLIEAFAEMYPELFSMALHFADRFSSFPGREYVGGEKVIIDWLNFQSFTIKQLKLVVVQYGNHDPNVQVYFFYKKPGGDLDFDLFPISSEEQVNTMVRVAKKTRFIEVYVEHGTTTMGDNIVSFTPTKTRNSVELGQTSNVCDDDVQTCSVGLGVAGSSNICRKLFQTDNCDVGSSGLDGNGDRLNKDSGGDHKEAPTVDWGGWDGIDDEPTGPSGFGGCDFGTFDFEGLDEYIANKARHFDQPTTPPHTPIPIHIAAEDGFPLDQSELLVDIDVDMSQFEGTFRRDDVNWLGKGVDTFRGTHYVGYVLLSLV